MTEAELIQKAVEAAAANSDSASGSQFITWGLQGALLGVFEAVRRNLSGIHTSLKELRELLVWLKNEHQDEDSPFSTVRMIPLLSKLVERDERQHQHNRWVAKVLGLLLRRDSKTPDEDALLLGPTPGGENNGQ